MVVRAATALCPACSTPLSRERWSEGLCPACALELALEDSSLEAEVLVEPEEAPTLQYSGYTFEEGQIQGERYRVRSLLGRGGMGEVWRAYDLKLRQDVALKALRTDLLEDSDALETLRQEVRTAREVISPNVCRVFDLQELDGQELVSMEYIDGTTLQEILKERSPLDLDEAREIASQFLAGLEAIHDAGLVHRDIKPENVMITRTGRVVVMDFGIAKGLGDGKSGLIAGTPAYMSPEQSRGGKLDARADVFSTGVVLAEMVEPGGVHSFEDRRSVWETIHRDTPDIAETPWSRVIGRCVEGAPDARFASAAELARALEEVTLRAVGDEESRPYPGLSAFQAEDARFFFGRELEVEALWKKLRRPHLLAVIGPSGAGKSSFLRAGLLPTLTDGWQAVIATPGDQPFNHLARALAPQLGDAPGVAELLQHCDEPDIAVELVSEWRRNHKHALLIVDQFEELFTQNPEAVQAAFAETMGRLPLEADLHVLLSMRDDFLFHCHRFEAFQPILTDLTLLGPPTGAALRRALVEPALRCGYRFEEESIVEEMLSDVEGQRGALPLLAFSAAQLWERRDRETGFLTRGSYEQIGGVGGALAQHAEAILDYIGESNIPIVREIFRNLVTAQGTRAARDREELLSVFPETEGEPFLEPSRVEPTTTPRPKRPAAKHVLNSLIDARLLTSYEVPADEEGAEPHHHIEVVHESLLSNWPRLVRWQMQDAEGAKLRDELRAQAQLWHEHGRRDDYLWSGTTYREFQLWRERYPGGLTATEEDFAKAMTSLAERRKRRRRTVAGAVLILAVVIATAMGILWRQSEAARKRAEAETLRAEAAKLLAVAQLQLEIDPTEGLAYTTASLELADTTEARLLALRLLSEAPPALVQVIETEGSNRAVFSPDGSRLAVAGNGEDVGVFAEEGGPPLVLSGHGSTTNYPTEATWASNELLVTSSAGVDRARIWSLPGGEAIREIGSHAIARGNLLLAEVPDIDAETGHVLYRLRSGRLPDAEMEELGVVDITALGSSFSWFTSDGSGWYYGKGNEIYLRPLPVEEGVPDRLVGWHDNRAQWAGVPDRLDRLWTRDAVTGELRMWDLSNPSGEPLRVFSQPGLEEGDSSNLFDPTGRRVGSLTRQVRVWDLDAWPATRPLRLRRSGSWSGSGAGFHPRGDWLVAMTQRLHHLTFWPLAHLRPRVVDGYSGTFFRPLAFSPDGKWLATTWGAKWDQVRLWPLPGNDSEVRTLNHPLGQPWYRIVFDPQARFVFLAGGPYDSIVIVPIDGSTPRTLEGFTDDSMTVAAAVSPSGNRLASAPSRNGPWTLRVWDLDTGELQLFDLPDSSSSSSKMGRARAVWSLAFTDETTLYSSGEGGIRQWNLESGSHELVYPVPPEHGLEMALAADGRTATVGVLQLEDAGAPKFGVLKLVDLATGDERGLPAFGEGHSFFTFDSSGTVLATGNEQGIIRVGRVSAEEPHLLLGHEGAVEQVVISPDGRWIASSGEDNTLRLWPMPDLDKPPLHTLPHDELIAKLKSLTNLSAIRDPESSTGWSIEVGPFPGWKEVPEW